MDFVRGLFNGDGHALDLTGPHDYPVEWEVSNGRRREQALYATERGLSRTAEPSAATGIDKLDYQNRRLGNSEEPPPKAEVRGSILSGAPTKSMLYGIPLGCLCNTGKHQVSVLF